MDTKFDRACDAWARRRLVDVMTWWTGKPRPAVHTHIAAYVPAHMLRPLLGVMEERIELLYGARIPARRDLDSLLEQLL